jgi:hypothetical protein
MSVCLESHTVVFPAELKSHHICIPTMHRRDETPPIPTHRLDRRSSH